MIVLVSLQTGVVATTTKQISLENPWILRIPSTHATRFSVCKRIQGVKLVERHQPVSSTQEHAPLKSQGSSSCMAIVSSTFFAP